MKLLVISGSRNPQGQTARAAAALVKGATEAGAEAETVFLPTMNIERCRQCNDNGWGDCRDKGECIIDDDLAPLTERIRGADAVVFANPVYFSSLSESLRAFTDRLRRIHRHHPDKLAIEGKPAVGVCVAGGGGGGAPNCCVDLEYVLQRCGFDVVDMVPARRQNLDMKVDVLPVVGRWLAKTEG